jgi:ABC-type transport system involved in cytochrome c biogenesis permease subunit
MASGLIARESSLRSPAKVNATEPTNLLLKLALNVVYAAASLKFTVALFSLSLFIILVGTLAQVDMDMWDVMRKYFLAWFTWVPFQVLFPRSWFPNWQSIPGGMPFPGGALIGAGLALNLLAAHLIRFQIQARGRRLLLGSVVMLVGALLTAAVIASGHNLDGLQGEPPVSWPTLWFLVKLTLALGGALTLASTALVPGSWQERRMERGALIGTGALLTISGFWLFILGEDAYLGESGMRVLWQLIQGGFSGIVLLVGCIMLFKKRGGVVLTHLGIGLLMFGQFWVAKHDVEEQISIREGETVTYAYDIRQTELAVVDTSDPQRDKVVVIPQRLLEQSVWRSESARNDQAGGVSAWFSRMSSTARDWFFASPHVDAEGIIRHPDLPFAVRIVKYLKNADLKSVDGTTSNLATAGFGLKMLAEPVRASTGTDSSGSVDLAAAYVELIRNEPAAAQRPPESTVAMSEAKPEAGSDAASAPEAEANEQQPATPATPATDTPAGSSLGTYLTSQIASAQNISEQVELDGRTYDVALRFRRTYKPYSLTLIDVRKDDYLGTSTPRNYSSDVRLVDASRDTDRQVHIWMNNPLRYAGETFYQSGYIGPPQAPTETTTLSVVTNSGWMIPYVACMLVAVGLPAHFLLTLLRFLNRRRRDEGDEELEKSGKSSDADRPTRLPAHSHKSGKRARQIAPVAPLAMRSSSLGELLPTVLAVGFFGILFFSLARPLGAPSDTFDLDAFGRLPVIADGRVKPFDTLARNTLRVISNRETFRGRMDQPTLTARWDKIVASLKSEWPKLDEGKLQEKKGDVAGLIAVVTEETGDDPYEVQTVIDKLTTRTYPATRWLLDVIARPEVAEQHQVFRIDNLEVLDTLQIKRRKGHVYSVSELRGGIVEFEKQVDQARKLDAEALSTYQRKLLDLDRRIRAYTRLGAAFQPPQLPPLPSITELRDDREKAMQELTRFQQAFSSFVRGIESIQPPLSIPVSADQEDLMAPPKKPEDEGKTRWESYATAAAKAFVQRQLSAQDPPMALSQLTKIMIAFENQDPAQFNTEIERYTRYLEKNSPEQLQSVYRGRSMLSLAGFFNNQMVEPIFGSFYGFESYFNRVAPFWFCWWPYLAAFVLTASSWLGWSKPLNRAAFWLIVFTFVIHTLALAARVYLSGRPPVTNLYSSAVFIGWAAVAFGLVLERVYRNSIGNAVASIIGFSTMVIAHNLAGDGDTFTVLQAVLDTQFWLTTHVVCITLGYATTFLAGAIGVAYILGGLFVPALNREARKEIARMIYGVVCFSIFLSFVGTVLGGLWADDSWGRFWGWDPKENGALMIVLWNALLLHARWGAMIKERGLALLAVGGNIITSWSWFGVNELGVGLHSYGFTEGVLLTLGLFVVSQLAVIAIGLIPTRYWLSYQADGSEKIGTAT